MDLQKTIQELYAEKRRLEEAIASMEELLASKTSVPLDLEYFRSSRRRGRKNMPPDERRRVSERMRKYWEQRRGNRANSAGNAQS